MEKEAQGELNRIKTNDIDLHYYTKSPIARASIEYERMIYQNKKESADEKETVEGIDIG